MVRLFAITLFSLALCVASIAAGADRERGQRLYETNCDKCHAASVHGRAKRVAKDVDEIREWVSRWSTHLSLGWTDEDIDDVVVYLNDTHYHYPCPPALCPIVSTAPTIRLPR